MIESGLPSAEEASRSHRQLLLIAALPVIVLAAVATVAVLAARQHWAGAERAAAASDLDGALYDGLSTNRPSVAGRTPSGTGAGPRLPTRGPTRSPPCQAPAVVGHTALTLNLAL